ncbi:hypothetical protein [Paraburkholderia sp. DHOC27]|uniref:hypothetical protein n=1 Tax=Paraburkholderia sp. DHOC27 TaxID=2303330 RepID=UPI000E3DFBEF|nr:hypothetical protein [Paraburkholderia sp. DHOC27]RFU45537.1 hypothetical protein D0B32_23335 [Paraburkholderia sp. DHOC27]
MTIFPCTLVFVDADAGRSPNSSSKDPLSYVDQAVGLNRSLVQAGMPRLTIFTNSPEQVEARLKSFEPNSHAAVQQLVMTIQLPKATPFYGAHFKLDLMDQLARTLPDDTLMLLLDADIVAVRPLNDDLITRCAEAGIGIFDISDQLFSAYGFASVINDLELVANRRLRNPRWYGGEFMLATPHTLALVVSRARECYERYLQESHRLLHHGDETFVSAALNTLADEGQGMVEVGAWQAIGRHWAGNCYRNLAWFRSCSLVHLPAGKGLLQRQSHRATFVPVRFWRDVLIAHWLWRGRLAIKRVRNSLLASVQKKPIAPTPRSAR